MAAESSNYKTLKKNWPCPYDRIDRIENAVVDGMPDINMEIDGHEIWIEQKSPTEPKRATTPLFGSNHKISQAQKNWFLRHYKAGGVAFFLLGTDKRWLLITGEHADTINEMTIPQLIEVSIWNTNKPIRDKEKWIQLRLTLIANSN